MPSREIRIQEGTIGRLTRVGDYGRMRMRVSAGERLLWDLCTRVDNMYGYTITPCIDHERGFTESGVRLVVTGAMLIQCPRGTAKPSTEVVGAAGSILIAQCTKREKKRYLYPLNQDTTAASAELESHRW